jgi:chloramphenicol 3-O phosphotransferase
MKPGTIIILNGASSSGKTTLLRTLQNACGEPYLEAGIDKFIWMLPKRYLDRPLWDDVLGLATQAGQTGHTLISGMHQAIVALSRSGNNVLADHVLVEPAWLRQCVELFAGLPAYLVAVDCPLAVLEERERSRKDRTLGQAQAQFPLVHARGVYDVRVDTSVEDAGECARKVMMRVQDGPPVALVYLRNR